MLVGYMLVPQGSLSFTHSLDSKNKRKHKESYEDCKLGKKTQKAWENKEDARKSKRLKALIVIIKRGGIVTDTFKGKVTWDDMI